MEQSRQTRTQTRMSKILDKIRQGKSSNTRPRVDKEHRLQVRWLHYNTSKKDFVQVKQKKGGGHRFICYYDSESLTLKGIEEKATALFFPKCSNNFAGKMSEMSVTQCDSTGVAIFNFPGAGTVGEYFKANGLYPSSTYFFVRTQPLTLVGDKFENDDDDLMVSGDNLDTKPVQAQAQTHHYSYVTYKNGEMCLRCEQNKAYAAGLLADPSNYLHRTEDKHEDKDSSSSDEDVFTVEKVQEKKLSHLSSMLSMCSSTLNTAATTLISATSNTSTTTVPSTSTNMTTPVMTVI